MGVSMVTELNFFESVDYLEPKCPKCQCILDYGVTTVFDEKRDCHVCKKCGFVLK
jgi:hypothetical protein